MEKEFEVLDKTGRKIYLTKERLKHILKHPHTSSNIETIKEVLKNPHIIRKHEINENSRYYYGHFKNRDPLERYLLILVRYLNNKGFIITAFFTNRIIGE